MSERPLVEPSFWRSEVELDLESKLTALLADDTFLKAIEGAAREAVGNWCMPLEEARRTVLSGLGELDALRQVHDAWITGKTALARLIIRRRMLDRFAEDARRPNHTSLVLAENGDAGLGRFGTDAAPDPLERLVAGQTVERALGALDRFAATGEKQHAQADLLRRHFGDETPYAQLSAELACSQVALRVRIFKALKALRKHIAKYHPELWRDDAVTPRLGRAARGRRASRTVRRRDRPSSATTRTSGSR